MRKDVLVVEDERELHDIIRESLGDEFDVTCVSSANAALDAVKDRDFRLILLDVKLPDGHGFELCAKIKKDPRSSQVPILFLSGMNEVRDRVAGLEVGADDYISKPFDPDELLARAKARTRARPSTFGDLRVNWDLQKAYVVGRTGEKDALLTPVEFRILACIIKSETPVVSRDHLLKNIWSDAVHVGPRSVDKHVCTLRRKLGTCANYVVTVPNKGYRFASGE